MTLDFDIHTLVPGVWIFPRQTMAFCMQVLLEDPSFISRTDSHPWKAELS